MDFTPIAYQETFQIIQELNAFIDELDSAILYTQQQYKARKIRLAEENARNLSKFDYECEEAVRVVKATSHDMIFDARKIQTEMSSLDGRLAAVDKYYVKTKKNKKAELAGVKNEQYDFNDDYFEILDQLKRSYIVLNLKYSEDILPNLINGLNYLFSNKRKRDYEELLLLLNTVDAFVNEIEAVMPELTAETVTDMRSKHEQQRTELITSQKAATQSLEDKHSQTITSLAIEIDEKLNAILPDELVDYMAYLTSSAIASFGKVNSSRFVANNILAFGLVDYPIAEFIQSQTLASYINAKCKKLIVSGSIKFPLLCSTASALPFYIKNGGTSLKVSNQITHSIMFAFLSSSHVSKFQFSVIDCENHGNSVEPYFEAKKKMPELFGEQIYTAYDAASAKIRALNDEIERISQNVLGTRFASVFEYAKENPESEYGVELLAIFDLPKGFDEYTLSALENIILHGPRCGIYTLITENTELSEDTYSKEFISYITRIRKACVVVQQDNTSFSIMGLQFLYCAMPTRNDFNIFFDKYLLINEGIKNRGIAFPSLIKHLVDSPDDKALEHNINTVHSIINKYDEGYGCVPKTATQYPEQVIVGQIQYPADVFSDSFGYEKIKNNFSVKNGRVMLPLSLDLSQSANLLLTCDESRNADVAAFTHHIIWSFLSSLPVTKTNVIIFDAEKRGGNAAAFLGFNKICPDVFDERLYSNVDDIADRLSRLSKHIDSLIQDKLGSRFTNLFDYNRNTPNRTEPVTVLVVYDFPSNFDARSLNMLQNILKNGGKCGIYTIICHNKEIRYSSYEGIDEHIELYQRYCTQLEWADKSFSLFPFNLPILIKAPLSLATIDRFVDEYKHESDRIKNKGLLFSDILDDKLFSKNLSSGLSIPVGLGDGERVVPITFGVGSSHHALVAGATGGGKSTLLHTLILSAMLHYTPNLLHLYLMDFKSGTEFKTYDSKRLPHIKLLALDAMQEFGESILENLVAEMGRRGEKFKAIGVSKLGEYVKLSGEDMPQILVIMDEFQVLYNDSTNRKVAYNCAELTKCIVTEGRSFGIHLLMATQSTKIISDLTLATGTVEQMRIRIGLKCGEWDVNYLFSERNDTKALEMMKGPIGTAVMNLEYTESELIGFRAAYCDDTAQGKYLDMIAAQFSDYSYDLQTFEGSRTVLLFETEYGLSGLQTSMPLSIEVGELIKVAPPLKIIIDRRRKHNTLICGSSERMAENLVNLYMLGVLKNRLSTLFCFDGERLLGPSPVDCYYDEYSRFGPRFTIADNRGEIISCINEIYNTYTCRKKKNNSEQIIIVVKNLQFLDIVKSMLKGEPINEADYLDGDPLAQDPIEDPFDFGASISDLPLNVSEKLLKLIDDGTAYGIHFLVSSLEFQSVRESMYFGENVLAKFPERYVFSLNDSDSECLIENISVAALPDNTVYYSDSVKSTFQLKPYIFPSVDELRNHLNVVLSRGEYD